MGHQPIVKERDLRGSFFASGRATWIEPHGAEPRGWCCGDPNAPHENLEMIRTPDALVCLECDRVVELPARTKPPRRVRFRWAFGAFLATLGLLKLTFFLIGTWTRDVPIDPDPFRPAACQTGQIVYSPSDAVLRYCRDGVWTIVLPGAEAPSETVRVGPADDPPLRFLHVPLPWVTVDPPLP